MSIPPLYVVRLAECAGYYKYWSDRTEERCFGAELMSALGHKRTLLTTPFYVRFTSESGHRTPPGSGSVIAMPAPITEQMCLIRHGVCCLLSDKLRLSVAQLPQAREIRPPLAYRLP